MLSISDSSQTSQFKLIQMDCIISKNLICKLDLILMNHDLIDPISKLDADVIYHVTLHLISTWPRDHVYLHEQSRLPWLRLQTFWCRSKVGLQNNLSCTSVILVPFQDMLFVVNTILQLPYIPLLAYWVIDKWYCPRPVGYSLNLFWNLMYSILFVSLCSYFISDTCFTSKC